MPLPLVPATVGSLTPGVASAAPLTVSPDGLGSATLTAASVTGDGFFPGSYPGATTFPGAGATAADPVVPVIPISPAVIL